MDREMASLIPPRLVQDGLLRSAARHSDKTALVTGKQCYSYGQLLDAALRLAGVLLELGVQRGDRVAIYMDNTWPCIVSIYGVLMAGGVFLLVNPQTKAEKLRFILKDSEAAALLTDQHLASQFTKAVDGLEGLQGVVVSAVKEQLLEGRENIIDFDAVVNSSPQLRSPVSVIANDLAALIYTSGSTGHPKGVMMTHQAMVFAAWSLIEYLRLSQHDRILLVLPLAFDYGLYQLLMSVFLGACLIVERSFTFPGQIYQQMERQRVTVFPGVPTIFSTMLRGHARKPLCFPDVSRVTNTAAALSPDCIPRLREIFPNALIYKMYGLTECKRVCYLEPELIEEKPASVGKAIPGTEVFLLSPEGEEVVAGGSGILHVRGPHVMAGYWKRPELTRKWLKPGRYPGDRILCTGDWFHQDADGFLYFEGRSDDIIKTRGEKVSPVEVEKVLLAIEGIHEAVVFGVDDQQMGQAIVAWIAVDKEASLTEKSVRKICLDKLENFMVPQRVLFSESLPRTANGKIDKRSLKKKYQELYHNR